MKRFTALSLLLTLATSMGGSASGGAMAQTRTANGGESADSSSGNTLTLRYWQAPSVLIPYLSAGTKDWEASSPSLEPLAIHGPDGDLIPRLATAIPTLANGGVSPDGRTMTWTIKDGVRWSDGSPMTAEDVVFTWKYCLAPGSGCQAENVFDDVVTVEALDPRTVKIKFAQPKPYPYGAFVGAKMPIISQDQFADCLGVVARSCAEERLPLGTGPYRITDFTMGEDVAYVKNPFFRGTEPYFDRILLRGGGTSLEGAQAVLADGTADYSWNVQEDPQVLKEMEDLNIGRLAVAFGSAVERIFINQTNPSPTLGQRRSEYDNGENPHPFLTFTPITQALSMAIDRQILVEQLYGFAGKPACNIIVGPSDYVSIANDTCLVQDIAGANALLDANGVVDNDGDGIREYGDVPLHITFQTSDNAVRKATHDLLQEWWGQIGISTDLILHGADVFFGGDPALQKGQTAARFFADAQMFSYSTTMDPEQFLSEHACSSIPTSENRWSGYNASRMCNESYDRILLKLRQTSLGPERQRLVKQLNDIIVQNGYAIPLVSRSLPSAVANTLQGFVANPWDSQLWNIDQWSRNTAAAQQGRTP